MEFPGRQRAARIAADVAIAEAFPERWKAAMLRAIQRGRSRSGIGLKRMYVPGSEFEGTGVLTPYFIKERRRRRAANRVARRARRRNR